MRYCYVLKILAPKLPNNAPVKFAIASPILASLPGTKD